MKKLFRVSVFLGIITFLIACKLTSQVAPTAVATPFKTLTLAATPMPTQTPITTIEPLPTLPYNPPTLFPTFDPTSAPKLLSEAFSLHTIEGVNRYTIQQITGWDYGFRQQPCYSYQWLDSNHLLLYLRTGQQIDGFTGAREDLSSELVVINLTNGNRWLQQPQSSTSNTEWDCDAVYWSRELGIIINQKVYGTATGPAKEAVFTYTFDGQEIARYWGTILGVSPKGTKVLVDDDTIIDLSSNKITDLAWYMNYDFEGLSKLYWSSDETRLYRCCFYFADLKTGESYNFEWSDLRGPDGKLLPYPMHAPHTGGQWIRNDIYFFPTWDLTSYAGDPIGMFSPTTKKYYFIERSSTPPIDPDTLTYTFSPDGMYAWMRGVNRGNDSTYSFLSNLTTLETTSYDMAGGDFEWSPDGKFGCLSLSSDNISFQINLLSVSSKKLEPLSLKSCHSWRPNDHLLAYFAEEGQVLTILNPSDMSVKGWKLPSTFGGLIWSPSGDRIALVAKDGSFWQVDYPKMDNFEQLTQPMPFTGVRDIIWSPDSTSIAFIKDTDIYIVNTIK